MQPTRRGPDRIHDAAHKIDVLLLRTMTRLSVRLAVLLLVPVAGAVAAAPPAVAALPDKFAFVLWNGGAVNPATSYPAGVSVTAIGTGHFRVLFPNSAASTRG